MNQSGLSFIKKAIYQQSLQPDQLGEEEKKVEVTDAFEDGSYFRHCPEYALKTDPGFKSLSEQLRENAAKADILLQTRSSSEVQEPDISEVVDQPLYLSSMVDNPKSRKEEREALEEFKIEQAEKRIIRRQDPSNNDEILPSADQQGRPANPSTSGGDNSTSTNPSRPMLKVKVTPQSAGPKRGADKDDSFDSLKATKKPAVEAQNSDGCCERQASDDQEKTEKPIKIGQLIEDYGDED